MENLILLCVLVVLASFGLVAFELYQSQQFKKYCIKLMDDQQKLLMDVVRTTAEINDAYKKLMEVKG